MLISATVRDIAIIIVAIQSIVIGILLAILIWQIWRLAKMMQIEIKPIIEDTQETVSTIRGTTTFVGDNIVAPVVRTNRSIARARGTLRALASELSALRKPPPENPRNGAAPSPQTPAE